MVGSSEVFIKVYSAVFPKSAAVKLWRITAFFHGIHNYGTFVTTETNGGGRGGESMQQVGVDFSGVWSLGLQ